MASPTDKVIRISIVSDTIQLESATGKILNAVNKVDEAKKKSIELDENALKWEKQLLAMKQNIAQQEEKVYLASNAQQAYLTEKTQKLFAAVSQGRLAFASLGASINAIQNSAPFQNLIDQEHQAIKGLQELTSEFDRIKYRHVSFDFTGSFTSSPIPRGQLDPLATLNQKINPLTGAATTYAPNSGLTAAELAAQKNLTDELKRQGDYLDRNVKIHKSLLTHVVEIAASYRIVNSIINQITYSIKAIPDIGIQLEATKASLASTLSSTGNGEVMVGTVLKGIDEEAQRTGLSVGALRDNFKGFQASASLAGAQLQDVWKMFTNMNTVSSALHLTTDQTNHVFLALAQIFNKSKVQSEELVKQLGNLLPGAFASFAASMGITTEELAKQMKAGTVKAEETMLQFTEFMATRFGTAAQQAFVGFNAAVGRMSTSFIHLGESIYEVSVGPMKSIVAAITAFTNTLTGAIKGQNNWSIALKALEYGAIAATIYLAISAIQSLGTAIAATTVTIEAATASSKALQVSLWSIQGASVALQGAMAFLASPAVILAGIGLIVAALYKAKKAEEDFTKSIQDTYDHYANLKKIQNTALPAQARLDAELRSDKTIIELTNQRSEAVQKLLSFQKDVQDQADAIGKPIDWSNLKQGSAIQKEFAERVQLVAKSTFSLRTATAQLTEAFNKRETEAHSFYVSEKQHIQGVIDKYHSLGMTAEEADVRYYEAQHERLAAITHAQDEVRKELNSAIANNESEKKIETLRTNLKQLDEEAANYELGRLNAIDKAIAKTEKQTSTALRGINLEEQALTRAYKNMEISINEYYEKKAQILLKDAKNAANAQELMAKLAEEKKADEKALADLVTTVNAEWSKYFENADKAIEKEKELTHQKRLAQLEVNKDQPGIEQAILQEKQRFQASITETKVTVELERQKELTSEYQQQLQEINELTQTGYYSQTQAQEKILELRKEYIDASDRIFTQIQRETAGVQGIEKLHKQIADARRKEEKLVYTDIGAADQVLSQQANDPTGMLAAMNLFSTNKGKLTRGLESELIKNQHELNLALEDNYLEQQKAMWIENDVDRINKLEMLEQKRLSMIEEYAAKGEAIREKYDAASLANLSDLMAKGFGAAANLFMGLTEMYVKAYGANSKEARKAFALYKTMKSGEVIISTASAAMAAYEGAMKFSPTFGPYIGAALVALVTAQGAMQLAAINAQQMPSAHGGLDYVPREQTYLLDKGERVLSPRQNKDLTGYLNARNNNVNNNNIKIVNVIDPSVVHQYLNTPNGEQLVMNIVRRNS